MSKQTPMREFVITGRELDDVLVPGTYELEENGDLKGEGGQHVRGLEDVNNGQDADCTEGCTVWDSAGRQLLSADYLPELRDPLFQSLRDFLDRIDPVEG